MAVATFDLASKEDLAATKVELKRDIDDVRREIKDSEQRVNARIDLLAAELKTTRTELKGEILLLKWMFGVGMTISIAMLGIVLRILLIRMPV